MDPVGVGFVLSMRTWWSRRSLSEPADCRQVARVVQRHIDGELDGEAAEAVARHLEMCRKCGLDAETYRRLKRQISGLHEPVDADAVERLRRFVDELTVDH
jgi:anti-sigma factor RsiW